MIRSLKKCSIRTAMGERFKDRGIVGCPPPGVNALLSSPAGIAYEASTVRGHFLSRRQPVSELSRADVGHSIDVTLSGPAARRPQDRLSVGTKGLPARQRLC